MQGGRGFAAHVPRRGELDFLTKRRQKSRAKRTVDVPCEPLSSLMARHGLASADFLSLDVEGAEGKVLETVDIHALSRLRWSKLSQARRECAS